MTIPLSSEREGHRTEGEEAYSEHDNKSSLLTQVGTEGHHHSSIGGYSATVGPSGRERIIILSTIQSDELGIIPHKVELLSSSR